MAFVVPIKSKSADNAVKAMHGLFKKVSPESLRTDKGLEFKNKEMKDLFRAYGVHYFTSKNKDIKCAVVERFNNIESKNDFVKAYNRTVHRSIGIRPIDVKKLYGDSVTDDVKSKIMKGNKVRVTYERKPFDKSYYPNWTDHIYTVSDVSKKQKPLITLKDYDGKK
ncbi:NACHT: LRR and PYD domains-containing protein 3-like protein [Leptotrombidium deliense]|uniref:NACHT: LRR and PYD domains-containing protein 3-like protein n=1 Tax=Leptotrombidium deliense TaxID=299467 RepID=A0A443S6R5_9ACAR|nr:NACHT: LRR and PYD domains-containing protein 3-like protein [Leptotrombidium deliense]